MSEAEEAWYLFNVLQNMERILWKHYQGAFLDFIGEDAANHRSSHFSCKHDIGDNNNVLPF